MKNKKELAAKSAALALAAVMTAGMTNVSVRDTLAASRIPAGSVSLSSNVLKKAPGTETPKKEEPKTETPKAEAVQKEEAAPAEPAKDMGNPVPAAVEAGEQKAAEQEKELQSSREENSKAADPVGKTEGSAKPAEGTAASSAASPEKNPTDSTVSAAESLPSASESVVSATESVSPASESAATVPENFEAAKSPELTASAQTEAGEGEQDSSLSDRSVISASEDSDQLLDADKETPVLEEEDLAEETETFDKEPEVGPLMLLKADKEELEEAALVGEKNEEEAAAVGAMSGATQLVGDTSKVYKSGRNSTAGPAPTGSSGAADSSKPAATPAENPAASGNGGNHQSGTGQAVSGTRASTTSKPASSGARKTSSEISGTVKKRTKGSKIKTSAPQTGDQTGILLYALMMAATLPAIFAAWFLSFKKPADPDEPD